MSGATTSLSCSQAAMPSSLTLSQAVIPMSSAALPTQALNPRAPLFVSNQPSLHPPKKATTGPKKKAKQVPSTDPTGLENEYNKYAINVAKTKICEQETELKDLKFRNKILEDRIAALEKKKKQEVHDDILSPTTQTCRAKLPGGCSQTSHSCCHSTSAHCCSSRAALPPCSINLESQKLLEAVQDIKSHGELVTEILHKLDSLSNALLSRPPQVMQSPVRVNIAPSNSSEVQNTASPAPPCSSASEEDIRNTSAHSIDYAMSDFSSECLNSQHPTTQLS